MKSYEVTLSRTVTQKVRTVISVSAKDDTEAVQKAREFAISGNADWSSSLTGDPEKLGEIQVESVEAIVDLDDETS